MATMMPGASILDQQKYSTMPWYAEVISTRRHVRRRVSHVKAPRAQLRCELQPRLQSSKVGVVLLAGDVLALPKAPHQTPPMTAKRGLRRVGGEGGCEITSGSKPTEVSSAVQPLRREARPFNNRRLRPGLRGVRRAVAARRGEASEHMTRGHYGVPKLSQQQSSKSAAATISVYRAAVMGARGRPWLRALSRA